MAQQILRPTWEIREERDAAAAAATAAAVASEATAAAAVAAATATAAAAADARAADDDRGEDAAFTKMGKNFAYAKFRDGIKLMVHANTLREPAPVDDDDAVIAENSIESNGGAGSVGGIHGGGGNSGGGGVGGSILDRRLRTGGRRRGGGLFARLQARASRGYQAASSDSDSSDREDQDVDTPGLVPRDASPGDSAAVTPRDTASALPMDSSTGAGTGAGGTDGRRLLRVVEAGTRHAEGAGSGGGDRAFAASPAHDSPAGAIAWGAPGVLLLHLVGCRV